jgi:hypothetical protein
MIFFANLEADDFSVTPVTSRVDWQQGRMSSFTYPSPFPFPFEHDVLAAQSGDQAAFSRLVDAYSGVVSAITLAIVRDVATSEDVAQNVFVASTS